MERKCRELLLFILSPAMLFNFQKISRFYFGKKILKILRKLQVYIIQKNQFPKAWHKVRTQ